MTTSIAPATLPMARKRIRLLGQDWAPGDFIPLDIWNRLSAQQKLTLTGRDGHIVTDPLCLPTPLQLAEQHAGRVARQLDAAKQRAADAVQRIEQHEARLEQLSVAVEAEKARRPQLAADRKAADGHVAELAAEHERATQTVASLRGAA